jgi:hypothetical protein
MKLETGKYYMMTVSRKIDVMTNQGALLKDSSIVYFYVERIEEKSGHPQSISPLYNIWSNNRITIERSHRVDSSIVGHYTGKRFIPRNHTLYSYTDPVEISEELFSKKIIHAKYGL